jgi:hypothetical protein
MKITIYDCRTSAPLSGAIARQHGRDNRPGSGPGQIPGVMNFT